MSLDPRTASVEDLLQALTVGDLTPDDPRVGARLAQDPALQVRWQALASTLASLAELDSGMSHDGDRAAPPSAPANPVVVPRTRPASRRWVAVAAAAAALLLVFSLLRSPPAPGPDPHLGSGARIGGLTPDHTPWAATAPLRWQSVPRAVGYRLYVEPTAGGATMVLPNGERGEALAKNEWLPTATERAALPAEFRWRVVAFDASEVPIGTSQWATTRR